MTRDDSRGTIFKAKTASPDPHSDTVGFPPMLKERRAKSRYQLDLGVRFRLSLGSREYFVSGAGRTVNLSAGGLLVSSQELPSHEEVAAGAWVEMSIEWPVLLDGRIPLQLFAVGRVVRRSAVDFAATLQHRQFRTLKRSSLSQGEFDRMERPQIETA
jgi:hypothetical protein